MTKFLTPEEVSRIHISPSSLVPDIDHYAKKKGNVGGIGNPPTGYELHSFTYISLHNSLH